ncbi:hypothetical protein DFH94DRAFT_785652, partial [Russula ochroleuca]
MVAGDVAFVTFILVHLVGGTHIQLLTAPDSTTSKQPVGLTILPSELEKWNLQLYSLLGLHPPVKSPRTCYTQGL